MTREVAEAHGPIKLKVMADYGCFVIWDDGFPTGAIDPASLPLTPGLVDDLPRSGFLQPSGSVQVGLEFRGIGSGACFVSPCGGDEGQAGEAAGHG